MLRVNNLVGLGAGPAFRSVIDVITDLGLDTDLKLCLDLGDANCYGGSGQTLVDLSGTQDAWLGASGSAEGSDPAFNGGPGGLGAAEYLSVDGGDWVTLKSKPAWIDACHKTNGVWSVLAGIYIPNLTGENGIFGNGEAAWTNIGISLTIQSSEVLTVTVGDGGGSPAALDASSSGSLDTSAWNIVGISVDEAAGAGNSFFHINGAEETFDGSYTSPSSSAATYTPEVMASGNGNDPFENGGRLAFIGVWDAALSVAHFDGLWADMKARFGL